MDGHGVADDDVRHEGGCSSPVKGGFCGPGRPRMRGEEEVQVLRPQKAVESMFLLLHMQYIYIYS